MASAETLAKHFEAIVLSSDDAIISKDRHAYITSWNPAAEELYGYTADEALGEPVSILVPPDRAGEESRILDRILTGERVDHYEAERLTKDGRTVYVSLTVSPIRDYDENIVGASVIARDVSERRRALERAERLRDVTEQLSREIRPERAIEILLENAVP